MEELEKYIEKELPIGGEWYSDNYIEFIDSAKKMSESGMKNDDIKEILFNLYYAIVSEFSS